MGHQIAPWTRFRNAIALLWLYITRLRGKLDQNSSLGESHKAIPPQRSNLTRNLKPLGPYPLNE